MKTHVVVCALLLAGLALGGCAPEDDATVPFTENGSATQTEPSPEAGQVDRAPKPLPDNYADPAKPTMVPYYDLPDGWEVSPSSKFMLRATEGRVDPAYLLLDLYDANLDLKQSAEKRKSQLGCVDGQSQFNIWLDCQIPLREETLEIGGREVVRFSYHGTWRGAEVPVEELLFVDHERVYIITLEAGNEEDLAAAKTIIGSLEFRYEVFTPGVEDEELGGL